MDDQDDDGRFNEEVSSQPMAIQIMGDLERGKSHIWAARRYMGQLRAVHGIGSDSSTSYYKKAHTMADGSLIEVSHNNGVELARIIAPPGRSVLLESEELPPVTEPELATPTFEEESPTLLPPPVFQYEEDPRIVIEEEPTEEDPRGSYAPYLWIGARIVSGRIDQTKLHVCVWELDDRNGHVILSNRNQIEEPNYDHPEDNVPTSQYPLGYWTQFIPDGFDPGDGDTTAIAYTDKKLVMVLPQNVYGVPMQVPGEDDGTEWEVMFISDPDNDLALSEGSNAMIGADGGDYMVKVMVVNPDCTPRDEVQPVEVELRIITGKNDGRTDDTHRFTINEFTSYKMGIMPFGWFPVQEEEDEPGDECSTCSEVAEDYGANPHGRHWWQGMADVQVPGAQDNVPVKQVTGGSTSYSPDGQTDLPPTGFEPGDFLSRLDRCPACESDSYSYHLLGYVATNLFMSSVHFDFWPVCGAKYVNTTSYTRTGYPLEAGNEFVDQDPLYSYWKAGKVSAGTFVGDESGGTKSVPFIEAAGDDALNFSGTNNVVYLTLPSEPAGFLICAPWTNLPDGDVYFQIPDGAQNLAIQKQNERPYEWYAEGMSYCYKIHRVVDKHGQATTDEVITISLADFLAIPDPSGTGTRFTITCTRVEQD